MSLISEISDLVHSSPYEAIKKIKGVDNINYYPWIAYFDAQAHMGIGEFNKSKYIYFDILKKKENFGPALVMLFEKFFESSTLPDKLRISSLGVNLIRYSDFISERLRPFLLRSIFFYKPYDYIDLLRKINNIDNLGEGESYADLYFSLSEVHAKIPKNIARKIDHYNFGFCGGSGYRIYEGCIFIGVESFCIPEVSSTDKICAELVFDYFGFMFYGAKYLHELGEESFGFLCDDALWQHAKFWELLTQVVKNKASIGSVVLSESQRKYKKIKFKKGDSFVRPGNVELKALWSYFKDKDDAKRAVGSVLERSEGECSETPYVIKREKWWPAINAEENIGKLRTNAGWYTTYKSPDSWSDFSLWAEGYVQSLKDGKILGAHKKDFLTLIPLVHELGKAELAKWSDRDFINSIRGRRVVLVSPFSDIIEERFLSGQLNIFWREVGVDLELKNLKCVASPMTIWPYSPDSGWKESFDKLKEDVLSSIDSINAEVVVSSCGCYGLPLVFEIGKERSVFQVYYGHAVNAFFGVYTKTLKEYKERWGGRNWVDGGLGKKFPDVKRVDDGRYV
ncbi:hypothetical protein [Vreelandella aquamarina]|uniref:hypothetical protein n=1 Tax=Vreelandella aquamarina TaxID=77097 RepID=UPI0007819478|nr:hypothetical protein [Halomonas axialensis]